MAKIIIIIVVMIFIIATYPKWSWKKWAERCEKRTTGKE
jgi:membrane protein YdbS with pleckstrin-like domain